MWECSSLKQKGIHFEISDNTYESGMTVSQLGHSTLLLRASLGECLIKTNRRIQDALNI